MKDTYSPLNSEFDMNIPSVILMHKYEYLAGSSYSGYTSGRQSYGFVYVIDGSAQYIFDKSIIKAEKNNILFLPSKAKYSVTNNGEVPLLHFTVNFDLVPDKNANGSFYNYLSGELPLILKTKNAPYFESQFQKLLNTWNSKKSGFKLEAKARLYSLASEFFSEFSASMIRTSDYERIIPVKRFIDENYIEQITLSTLTDISGMSETSMRRLFYRVFGISPIEYKNELRLMKAKDLLLTGVYSIAEISEMCGFEDANYFSRLFKKYNGISPLKYKTVH